MNLQLLIDALTPSCEGVTQTVDTLFQNRWLSLKSIKAPEMGVTGYVFSHETRCKGRIVAVLPYRKTATGIQYLVKSEITPSWGLQPHLSALTGGWEGGEIVEDAQRELMEESGYDLPVSAFVSLGECFASKSSDTVYSLFTVDLTKATPSPPKGDGSRLEAIAESPWMDESALLAVMDAQVHVMLNRLKVHLQSLAKPA